MKKLIFSISSIILLLFIFVSVQATESPAFRVSLAEAFPGETVAIIVETVNNPGIASFDLGVEYDASKLEWVDVKKGNFEGTMDVAVGQTITWFDADNCMDDTVVATLYFKVKPDTYPGNAKISVFYKKGDVFDIDEKDVDFSVVEGGVVIRDSTSVGSKYLKVEGFVSRLYKNFLGREPDEPGLDYWCDLLVEGEITGSNVVYGFVYSREFQENPLSNEAFVTAMYETILGREPDTSGLNSWVAVLEKGFTRKKVLSGFLNSVEMKNLCDSIGIRAGSYESDEIIDKHTKVTDFVSRMYKYCLGRQADYPGLTSWVTELVKGNATGTKIATGFFYSEEMKQKKLSDHDYVVNAYRALLGREPDADGLNYWVSLLGRNNDRTKIVNGFVRSVEFGNLCSEYGIIR